jgi:hypothetical protein
VEGILNDEWFAGYNDRRHRLKLTEMVNWKGWSLTGSWQFWLRPACYQCYRR